MKNEADFSPLFVLQNMIIKEKRSKDECKAIYFSVEYRSRDRRLHLFTWQLMRYTDLVKMKKNAFLNCL